MKKSCLSLVLVVAMGVAACIGLAGCNTSSETLSYVSLRINPEIELVTDKDGNVLSAGAVNDDGEVVLTQVDLEGKPIEQAAQEFTETAEELGYIDLNKEDATVNLFVESDDADVEETVKKTISERLNTFFSNNGKYGKIKEETLTQYASQADSWGLSVGHTKMALRILDMYPEMSTEEVIALHPSEMTKLIKGDKTNNGIAASLRKDYQKDMKALKEKYAEMYELGDRIEKLEKALEKNPDDEASATELAAIKEDHAEMKTAFKAEADELKATYREKSAESIQQSKQKAEDKKNNKI